MSSKFNGFTQDDIKKIANKAAPKDISKFPIVLYSVRQTYKYLFLFFQKK
jgi:hypothetical protein